MSKRNEKDIKGIKGNEKESMSRKKSKVQYLNHQLVNSPLVRHNLLVYIVIRQVHLVHKCRSHTHIQLVPFYHLIFF